MLRNLNQHLVKLDIDVVKYIALLNFSTQYIGRNKSIDLTIQESGENSGKELQKIYILQEGLLE
jgi:hypothetical protein